MSDSPTNGTSTDTPEPPASDGDVLAELRSLVLGPEQMQLRRLQEHFDNFRVGPEDVGRVLPDAIRLRSQQDNLLTNAIRDTVEEALGASVRKNRQVLLDILFPLIGAAVRKAIASALRSMIESLNHSLDVSLSVRGMRWRLEALRTGKPFAEVVLLHTLDYGVEQVFLIHRESGILLRHVAAMMVASQDPDLVSGMLTAIQDFMRDSFGVEGREGLATVQIGALTVWIEQGPEAIVAAVVRGNGPQELRLIFQEALEAIHLEQRENLKQFRGDTTPFEASRHHLEACLLMEYKPRQQRTSPLLWIICAAMLAALGFWAGWMIQERQRWTNFLEMLKAEPGIVLATVERKDGKYVIAGLLDPLATEPHRLLQEAHLDSSKVISRWEPYHAIYPAFILHRANTLLAPPDTVHLSLDNGVLRAIGSAPHAWIVEAERLSRLIPGVVEFHHDLLVDTALAELAVLKQRIEQDRLHFRINALQLAPGQEDTFQRLSASMHRLHDLAQSAHAHVSIQIRGHTDTTGGEGKNQQLSQERADRILSTLAAEGLARASMSAVGVSTKEPLVDEVTEEDRALNRRVSFRVNLTGIAKP